MIPLSQNNAGGLINRAADKVSDFKDKVVNFKEEIGRASCRERV